MITAVAALAAPPSAIDVVTLRWVGPPLVHIERRSLVFNTGGWTLDDSAEDEPWNKENALVELSSTGGEVRPLTTGEEAPHGAVFSPNGETLAFVRDGSIHLLPLGGGEATVLDLKPKPGGFAFSPDGSSLRFIGTPKSDEDAAHRGGARRFERGEMARLYTVPITGGEPKELTDGTRNIVHFVEGARGIAVVSSTHQNPYENSQHPALGWLEEGSITPLDQGAGCAESPSFSPDGSRLAWIGCATGGLTDAVFVHDLATGTTERWIADTEPTLEQLEWLPDGRTLLARVAERTTTELWRFGSKGAPKVLKLKGIARQLALGPKGRVAYANVSSPDRPGRLMSIDLQRGTTTVLFDPNPHTSAWTLPETELVTWSSPEGDVLEGLFHAPAGEQKGLMVLPHGGPDGVSQQRFSGWVAFFTGRGYAIFEPNYRGGIAYGRDFYAANRGRMGPIEFMDIEAGVDSLIAAGKADEKALFYGGWSWGGYITTWTIAHTERYRAAMAGAAVVDTVAQYVGSDINHGSVGDWEYKGRPWTEPEQFANANPRRFLSQVKTPTLILHGDADLRVPFDQGVTLYRALEDQGIEVDFWVYPGEGHGLRKPGHNVHRMETWADWYDRH